MVSVQFGNWKLTTSPGFNPIATKAAASCRACARISPKLIARSPSTTAIRSGARVPSRIAQSATVTLRHAPARL